MTIPYIDNFLNKITMYRLVFYCLIFLLVAGFGLGLFGLLPFKAMDLLFSSLVITLMCLFVNNIFASVFKAPSNTESVYITAFILALIVSPAKSLNQFPFLLFVSSLGIASKYLLAINKKHVFNPAAFAVVAAAFLVNKSASWWIGTLYMAPFVLAIGLLITRKIQRTSLIVSFFVTSIACTLLFIFFTSSQSFLVLKEAVLYSPLLFFAFVMLTEPMTTPPTKPLQILYGGLVGFLFVPFLHIANFYISPELALILGNVFSYIVSPKDKLILQLKEKAPIGHNTYQFVFLPNKKLHFVPGQYMEWTLGHTKQDTRGIRRYFTVASSPTENQILIGVKFYEKPSSFKRVLESLQQNDTIVASQLAGDFTLPKDKNKKLVFLAGGIGVTPFRSMIKYLIDTNERRDIIMFYSNKHASDVCYKEIFDQAQTQLGIPIIYTLENTDSVPENFPYIPGFITKEMIMQQVPDYKERMFYISGPRSMILSFKKTLRQIGVHGSHIITDFFPGFA